MCLRHLERSYSDGKVRLRSWRRQQRGSCVVSWGNAKRYLFYKVFRKISMRVTGTRSRVSFASARTALELRLGKEARRVHGSLHALEKDY